MSCVLNRIGAESDRVAYWHAVRDYKIVGLKLLSPLEEELAAFSHEHESHAYKVKTCFLPLLQTWGTVFQIADTKLWRWHLRDFLPRIAFPPKTKSERQEATDAELLLTFMYNMAPHANVCTTPLLGDEALLMWRLFQNYLAFFDIKIPKAFTSLPVSEILPTASDPQAIDLLETNLRQSVSQRFTFPYLTDEDVETRKQDDLKRGNTNFLLRQNAETPKQGTML